MWVAIIFFLLALIICAYAHFNPELERLETGELVVWYNSEGRFSTERKYKILKKTKKD